MRSDRDSDVPSRDRYVDSLLPASEVAEIFGVSLRTIRRMIAAGDLPVVRLGRSVRVRHSILKRIIRNGL